MNVKLIYIWGTFCLPYFLLLSKLIYIYELYNLIFVFPFCSYYFIHDFFCNLEDFVIWDCLSQQLSFDKKPMPKFSIKDVHSHKSCIPKLHCHFDNIIIIQITSSKMVCAGFMNTLM